MSAGVAREVFPLPVPPDAVVTVPGSKSHTNRALVCASLTDGTSVLTGALVADDTLAMRRAVTALGATVTDARGGTELHVRGAGAAVAARDATIDAQLSGTTSRFALALAALGPGRVTVDGAPPLRARPMGPTLEALRELGADVEARPGGTLPATVRGPVRGGRIRISASESSQFVSGLLLAAPAMATGLRLELAGADVVSWPYLELTVATMADFGVVVGRPERTVFDVAPAAYEAGDHRIEPDASAASYFLAAAAITGGRVRVRGLAAARQGDVGFADVLAHMGARVRRDGDDVEVTGHELHGIEVDMSDLSDTAQTLAAVAVFAQEPTRVTGVGFIRHKETDRIGNVVAELQRCGIDATEEDDGFVVRPGRPRAASIRTYDDHRMAMSFALLGLRVPGITIEDPDCVAKTYPGFWDDLEQLRS